MDKIIKEVKKLSDGFKTIKKGNKEIVVLKNNDDLEHYFFKGDGNEPFILNPFNDFSYEWVSDFLNFLDYQNFEDDEELLRKLEEDELINEFLDDEISVYTSNLTEWLNNNVDNVNYLTEALEEFNLKDGFELLKTAQYLAIREVINKLIRNIENF